MIGPFPSVITDVENQRDEIRELLGPDAHLSPYLWTIVRDLDPLVVLDADGFVHLREGMYPTMEIYKAVHHDISRTTAAILQLADHASPVAPR